MGKESCWQSKGEKSIMQGDSRDKKIISTECMERKTFFSKISSSEMQRDILEEMKKETLPLVIWGGGSMSYSVRKILRHKGIAVAAYWIDHADIAELDGIPVMSIAEILQKYKRINVVLGHSKYELADDLLRKEGINKCFCLVNVCYEQWNHLSYKFVDAHKEEYYTTYKCLEDELSQKCLVAFLNSKLTEDFHHILPVYEKGVSYFANPFFEIGDAENLVDVGAYDGDTIREFLEVKKSYNQIYAIEPEYKSFCRVKEYVKRESLKNIKLYQCGCWNANTVLNFREDEESSGLGLNGNKKLEVYRLDKLLNEQDVSIIKINFLNGIWETLDGSADILAEQMPKIIVMVGFDEWSLIRIPLKIKELNPQYRISLRYAAAMPARLMLFAY